jgi:TolA-binding protein
MTHRAKVTSGNGVACAEADRVWLEGDADPVTVSRVEAHRQRCARCRATRERLVNLRADVLRAAPPIDDLTRARLLGTLAPALDGIASAPRPSVRARARRWLPALALGAVAAAATIALVRAPAPGPDPRFQAPQQASEAAGTTGGRARLSTAPPAGAKAAVPPARSLALLHPRRAPSSRAAHRHDRPAPPGVTRLELRDSRLVPLTLARHAQLALRGPALLEVVAVGERTIDLRLVRGALVVDYDRRRGGRLKIHSPGAITEVVGTLFSVEVAGEQTRVAVARGRVSVEAASGSRVLEPGQALLSDGSVPRPVPAPTRALLRSFKRQAALFVASANAPAPPDAATPADQPVASDQPAPGIPGVAPGAPVAPAAPVATPPAPAAPPIPAAPLPAPPGPALAPPPVAPLAPPGPAARYRLAESAMQRGAQDEARAQLEALVVESGGDRMAAVARYELAQMALRSGDRDRARRWLDELSVAGAPAALAEASHFLRCEVHLAAQDAQQAQPAQDTTSARRCLQAFRTSFPQSVNEPLALGLLLRLTPAAELCGPAAGQLDDFLRRFPTHRFARELEGRKAACPR